MSWNYFETILRYPTDSYYPSYTDHIKAHGPLSLALHASLVLSLPAVLNLILKKRELPWLLLGSMVPFTVASLICHFHSVGWFGFMCVPDAAHTAACLIFDIRLFWFTSLSSFALAALSLFVCRKPTTSAAAPGSARGADGQSER